jgi:NAD+ kinase
MVECMKEFLLIPNAGKDPNYAVTAEVTQRLKEMKGHVFFDERHSEIAARLNCPVVKTPSEELDCIVVIGGDGSVLDASVTALEYDIPLLGINLGRLGYLAELDTTDLSSLNKLFTGDYTTHARMTLAVEFCHTGQAPVGCERYALNEIAITHATHYGMADMTLTDNMGNHIRYRADGLLLATPSGSTAYSFSAGGPVIDPTLDAICVTPICPHSFFNRSMLLGPSAVITVTNTSKQDALYVSVDGRSTTPLESGEKITVRVGQKRLRMIHFGGIPTFTTLRHKMELAEMKE